MARGCWPVSNEGGELLVKDWCPRVEDQPLRVVKVPLSTVMVGGAMVLLMEMAPHLKICVGEGASKDLIDPILRL